MVFKVFSVPSKAVNFLNPRSDHETPKLITRFMLGVFLLKQCNIRIVYHLFLPTTCLSFLLSLEKLIEVDRV